MSERSVLVIFGSGGHAKAVIEAALAADRDRSIEIVDDNEQAASHQLLGIAVAGDRQWLCEHRRGASVFPAVGDNRKRQHLLDWLEGEGFAPVTIIHPAAVVGDSVAVGSGSFVAAGAILIADSNIGRGAIVNTGASVDHDCVIGDCAHIAPGVRLCGNVTVGERSLIGVGSAVRPGITIGRDCVVGAGSAVVCDLASAGTYAGCPARPLESGSVDR